MYTYAFGAVWPLIDWPMNWSIGALGRCCDRGCSYDESKTKAHSIQQYATIHAGPEFDIWNKYAAIINLVVVAFAWGISMPIYFPLCFIGVAIIYFTDKMRLAWYYQKPVKYDSQMTILVNWIVTYYAPVFMLLIGYWQFTNQSGFNN